MRYLIIIALITLVMLLTSYYKNKLINITFETTENDTPTGFNETQVYVLKKATENSDFNYHKIDNIDDYKIDEFKTKNIRDVFEPVTGQYKYYQFISTFIGEAYNTDGKPLFKDFHNILIIKTDQENKIIDAYIYTLEWSEPPLQYGVLKSSAKDIILKNNLDIAELKFKRMYGWSEDNVSINQNGIIKLN